LFKAHVYFFWFHAGDISDYKELMFRFQNVHSRGDRDGTRFGTGGRSGLRGNEVCHGLFSVKIVCWYSVKN
jgi:hypothetical protein